MALVRSQSDSEPGNGQRTVQRAEFDLFERTPDPALDELTELAAVMTGADFAYMGWIDYSRLWFKSCFGFQASEQARTATACQWMLDNGDSLLVPDASLDPRFPPTGIPLAGAQNCLSYAGVPLITEDGTLVGTFALLSRNRHRFSLEHLTFLEILGRQAVTRLELYNRIHAQERAQRVRQRTELALAIERGFVSATMDSIPTLVAVLDTSGRIVRLNETCAELTGLDKTSAVGSNFLSEVFESGDLDQATGRLRDAASGAILSAVESSWRTAGSGTEKPLRRVSWTLRPLRSPQEEIQYLILTGQDMTAQRQAESALRNSESRYRQVVESSLGFVFTSDMRGRLTSLNTFTAETLGYPVEHLAGHYLHELLEDDGADAFDHCLEALHSQPEWQGSIFLRRSDGIFRRIAFRSRRMEMPGEPPFLIHYGIDITEQHEAEEALRLAHRQRDQILRSIGEGIFGIDAEGRCTFVNEAAARILGFTAEQLSGADLHSLIHHSHPDGSPMAHAESPILQAMLRQTPIQRSDQFWRKDGSALPVEYTATPLLDSGESSGMVVVFQDASERRRIERMKDEFISTVSHELRTPLTTLRASLGLVSSGALEKRPEKRVQMVEMAIGNCDHLIRLVNTILDYEGIASGHLPIHPEPLEALELLHRASDIAHPAATQAHIRIRVEGPKLLVMAEEQRLLQVLGELLSNAIRFSPPETQIRLSVQPVGDTPRTAPIGAVETTAPPREIGFLVEDQGCGIAPEKLASIFNRLQQGDSSDSRALGGTGMGLALCRAIVERLGGHIHVESTPGRGSRFFFTLPAAPAASE